uniref:Protein D n=1 Tax=Escherichia coli TaxID=562 RepID=RPI_ECOLX|nr:RecName: Full=Protein D [Escherichia coli]CAA28150.1 unnamed protein product [Escherichia coli]
MAFSSLLSRSSYIPMDFIIARCRARSTKQKTYAPVCQASTTISSRCSLVGMMQRSPSRSSASSINTMYSAIIPHSVVINLKHANSRSRSSSAVLRASPVCGLTISSTDRIARCTLTCVARSGQMYQISSMPFARRLNRYPDTTS